MADCASINPTLHKLAAIIFPLKEHYEEKFSKFYLLLPKELSDEKLVNKK